MNSTKRINPKIISLIVIVLIVLASTGVYALMNANNDNATTTSTSVASDQTATDGTSGSTGSSSSTSTTTSSGTYKAGTYTETGSYSTPGGSESITVSLTLAADGTISDSTVTNSATRGDSAQYQSRFLSAYKQYVVGKKIDDVSLSRVSGSSLTSNGFNRALESIKTDAEA